MAETEHLLFLLKPTCKVVSLITDGNYTYSNEGFFYPAFDIVIDKSCSGYNFWLICFLMLTFRTVQALHSKSLKLGAIAFSLVMAYIVTLVSNSSRILALIVIRNQYPFLIKNSIVHEGVGVITHLTFLILVYNILERCLSRKSHAQFIKS